MRTWDLVCSFLAISPVFRIISAIWSFNKYLLHEWTNEWKEWTLILIYHEKWLWQIHLVPSFPDHNWWLGIANGPQRISELSKQKRQSLRVKPSFAVRVIPSCCWSSSPWILWCLIGVQTAWKVLMDIYKSLLLSWSCYPEKEQRKSSVALTKIRVKGNDGIHRIIPHWKAKPSE